MKHAIAAALAVCALAGATIAAPAASADPPGCQVVLWGFLGSQRRAICDEPVRADGSWIRHRLIAVPAHYVPMMCFTSGGGSWSYSSSYTSCSGGYYQPYTEVDNEVYLVTPDTVLPDEPGHL